MAQTSRISNTGVYTVNGNFDEFTGAPVVDSSVLLWLDAGQTSSYPGSGSTWTDLSYNGNNGTFSNTSFTNDQYGGFTTYNGSSSYASLTPAKYNTTYTGKTVFAVVRMNSSFGTGFRGIVGTADGTALRNFNTYMYYDGTGYRIHYSYGNGTVNNGSLSNYLSVGLNQWFVVAVTQNASTHSYYFNGVFDISRSGGYTAYNTTTNEFVGRCDGYWYGDIAQVMVYGRELSASEIAQNYNSICKRYGLAPVTSVQMPVVKRETSSGVVLVNSGEYDEVTYSTTSPVFKNLLTYSEQLDNAAWSQAAVGVTANVSTTLSPINDQTADKVYETAVNSGHSIQYGPIAKAANAVVTFSVFAKSAERTWIGLVLNDNVGGFGVGRFGAEFDLAAGTASQHDPAQGTYTNGTQTISSVGNGWYRCSITCTTFTEASTRGRIYLFNNNSSSIVTWTSAANYTGDGTSGVYLWGAQAELSSNATVYQGVAAANTLVTPNFVKRETNTGSIFVTKNFDEVTGMVETDGLVAYYDAGLTASQPGTGALWRDISDNQVHANVVGSGATFNNSGYFVFDGSINRYSTSALAPAAWTDSWTIEVWLNTPTGAQWATTNRGHLISAGSTFGTWGVIRAPVDNQLSTWVRGDNTSAESPRATLTRDRWNQYVGTWTGNTAVSSYLNGNLVGSTSVTLTGVPDGIGTGVAIGGAASTVSNSIPVLGLYYTGNIAAVLMYNRALSLDEINGNFNALRDRFGI